MTTNPGATNKATPKGREEIRKAVLDAADRLFATRRPSMVSVREIASEAGVNHALVHRHFGTKENLVRQALARVDSGLAAGWEQFDTASEVAQFTLGHRELFQQALLMLEGATMDQSSEAIPSQLVEGLVARLRAEGFDEEEAGSAAVTSVALILGWATFGEWLSTTTPIAPTDGTHEASVASVLREILHPSE